MEKVGDFVRGYLKWVNKNIASVWSRNIEDVVEEEDHDGFKTIGGLIGAAAGWIIYAIIAANSGVSMYPILIIISIIAGGAVGVALGSFAFGMLIFILRSIGTAFIVFGPPALAYLALLVAIGILRFLFSPLGG